MCASSPTDGVDISGLSETVKLTKTQAKKLTKQLDKIAGEKKRPISDFLKKQGIRIEQHKDLGDRLDDMIADIPLIDAAVAVAGFYAGWYGMTPSTMIFKGLWGFSKTTEQTVTLFGFQVWDPFGILTGEMKQIQKKYDEAIAAGKATADMHWFMSSIDYNTPEGQMQLHMKIGMGCIGLIEAVMITRPGALGGILGGIGSILQGIGEIVPL